MERLIPFTEKEATCNCGCGLMILNDNFLDRLLRARYASPYAFPITSWTRCAGHNVNVGGAPGSRHLNGEAVDIYCIHNYRRIMIVGCLFRAGFDELVLGFNYIHAAVSCANEDGFMKLNPKIRHLSGF